MALHPSYHIALNTEQWVRSRSFETVSLDLMDALADLEELQEALSNSTAVKADDNAQLADMAAKFFKGLSVIHLVCNTGQDTHTVSSPHLVLPCFRTAKLSCTLYCRNSLLHWQCSQA